MGSLGLAKAKADHDETLGERKEVHELSPEEKKELRTVKPVREEYEEDGALVLVGRDVEASVGMRIRMREGLISHGLGTITTLLNGEEEGGCCEVVWDSNQKHTRGLHLKMGNKHVCRVGKSGHYDLVLASDTLCSDVTIVKHQTVLLGRAHEHLEVVSRCAEPQPVPGLQEAAATVRAHAEINDQQQPPPRHHTHYEDAVAARGADGSSERTSDQRN